MALTIIRNKKAEEPTMFLCVKCKLAKDEELCAACHLLAKTHTPKVVVPEQEPEAPPAYTIFDALAELAKGKKGVLMLEHVVGRESYQVLSYDPAENLTCLRGSFGATLRVKLRQREVDLYRPFWR